MWCFRYDRAALVDSIEMEKTQERALVLPLNGYHLNYPTHYIKHNTAENSLNRHFAFTDVACTVSIEVLCLKKTPDIIQAKWC